MRTTSAVQHEQVCSPADMWLGGLPLIQRSLMPPPVYTGGFVEAAAVIRPRRGVGGDFYDYIDTGSEFHLLLGDVCGTGTPAALQAALVQGVLAAEIQSKAGVAGVVAHLNKALCRRGPNGRFVTLFYGVMTRDRRLTYCNAGHCRPILVGRSSVRRLCVGGVPAGLLADAVYEEESVVLAKGDALVAFSDGVAEAGNPDSEFGDERILQVVSEHRESSALTIRNRLMSLVREFTRGQHQHDDMTVLVVRHLA
ncbi:MAG TPA: PP2C family protein-serine/threonine phosphatase [Vicinamibacterales bacterium]|nr:PP2C family protein-serine/threonine phosphatase [Vicinamibacterales bacterium]